MSPFSIRFEGGYLVYLLNLCFKVFRISCVLMSFWYGRSFSWFIFRKSSKKEFEFCIFGSTETLANQQLTRLTPKTTPSFGCLFFIGGYFHLSNPMILL